MRSTAWALVLVSILGGATAFAQPSREDNPTLHPPDSAADLGPTPRMIVKFRSGQSAARVQAQAAGDAVAKLAARTGFTVRETRPLPAGLHALRVEPQASGESFRERLERVRADPDVEFAEPDQRRYPYALPNDPLYTGQWYLQNVQPSAVHAEAAWDSGVGSTGVVIAVVDTGILFDHPDLKRASAGGRVLPGYDFIDDAPSANDGGGRDADPTDPGDWITQAETNSGEFGGCGASNSSWHGTRVAGIIGARANNAEGIAGLTWNPWILPVRALGKCGGFDSDILDGMAWAGGLHVNGVPDNPYPAKVLNLSIGAPGGCGGAYASVVSALAARGVLVVVSAGNEGGPVASPANCAGVAAVAGLRHVGTKVGFSSLGPEVAVGAPGGNCVNVTGGPCLFSIDTTYNLGATAATTYGYTSQTNVNVGTSFSSPIVAGIVGLMASANGNLGASQLLSRLREGATTPFPVSADPAILACHVPTGPNDLQISECNCTTTTCGAGMANAAGAVAAALRPIAALATPAAVFAGQPVALSAAGSAGACGRTISSYAWQVVSGGGALTSTNTPGTALSSAPTSGLVTVRVTVTDDVGRTDSAEVLISSNSAATSAPASAGNNACPAAIAAPAPISVSISPTTASVQAAGGTQLFTPTVANAHNSAVTWWVDGVLGGNATVGTIAGSGVYTAPASVPAGGVTVTATSVEDTSQSASAQVTVTAAPAPPPASSGGGGGGAALDLLALLFLITAAYCAAPVARRAAIRR